MCTLILAWQTFDDPVVVGANRDERLDRQSEPPTVREWEPRAVAPRDADAGGTWIGYNEHGLLVALANRWVDDSPPGDRSRGLLVRDALRRESAEEAARFVERTVREVSYDGFNLVLADESAAIYAAWDGHLGIGNLAPGIHVVVNVGADGEYVIPSARADAGRRQAEQADRARQTLALEPGEDVDGWTERLKTVLSDHEYGFCVHGDGFGTRSSSLLTVGPGRRRYRYADGPPCEAEYRPVESQV